VYASASLRLRRPRPSLLRGLTPLCTQSDRAHGSGMARYHCLESTTKAGGLPCCHACLKERSSAVAHDAHAMIVLRRITIVHFFPLPTQRGRDSARTMHDSRKLAPLHPLRRHLKLSHNSDANFPRHVRPIRSSQAPGGARRDGCTAVDKKQNSLRPLDANLISEAPGRGLAHAHAQRPHRNNLKDRQESRGIS